MAASRIFTFDTMHISGSPGAWLRAIDHSRTGIREDEATDAVNQIQSFNAGREPEWLAMKYRAMRASPFAFLRGTCRLIYNRLPCGGVFKSAPLAWVCGDLHLENFGS